MLLRQPHELQGSPPTQLKGPLASKKSSDLQHTMDAFTSVASSFGLRLKELKMPAAATPDEVLRRFYNVLDLAEKDQGHPVLQL
jgi:hypothetical protein